MTLKPAGEMVANISIAASGTTVRFFKRNGTTNEDGACANQQWVLDGPKDTTITCINEANTYWSYEYWVESAAPTTVYQDSILTTQGSSAANVVDISE
jgi:hypothetical protein